MLVLLYVKALKELALPRATHSGEITLVGSRRLRSTLAAAPVLFAHTFVTVANKLHLRLLQQPINDFDCEEISYLNTI